MSASLESARQALGRKAWEGAIADCTEALRLDPLQAEAYFLRGLARRAKGNTAAAVADWTEALRLEPQRAAAHFERAAARLESMDFAGAIADLDATLRLDPRYPKAHGVRGSALALRAGNGGTEEDLAGAVRDLDEALRLDPQDALALHSRARIRATCPLDEFRDGPAAVADAYLACELSRRRNPAAIDTLAAAFAEVGDFGRAVEAQELAIALYPVEALKAWGRKRLEQYRNRLPARDSAIRRTARPAPAAEPQPPLPQAVPASDSARVESPAAVEPSPAAAPVHDPSPMMASDSVNVESPVAVEPPAAAAQVVEENPVTAPEPACVEPAEEVEPPAAAAQVVEAIPVTPAESVRVVPAEEVRADSIEVGPSASLQPAAVGTESLAAAQVLEARPVPSVGSPSPVGESPVPTFRPPPPMPRRALPAPRTLVRRPPAPPIRSRGPAEYVARGTAAMREGKFDAAIANFTEALRLEPSNPQTLLYRSFAFGMRQECEAAERDCTEAVRVAPRFAAAYRGRGSIRYARNALGEAIADFAEAIRLEPESAEGHRLLAWLLATVDDDRFRDGPRALDHAEKACELTGGADGDHLGTLAAALAETGDFARAIRRQEEAVALLEPGAGRTRAEQRLARLRTGRPLRE